MTLTIHWEREPQFQLINDGTYNRFSCVRHGLVILGGRDVHFPSGWVTDMTSIPGWARSLVPQLGAHAPAILIHDRLLEVGYTRKQARRWMHRQLRLLPGVPGWRRRLIVAGVWFFDTFVFPFRS